jgi:hypothetical protein
MTNQLLNALKKRQPPLNVGKGIFAQATTNQSSIKHLPKQSSIKIKGWPP